MRGLGSSMGIGIAQGRATLGAIGFEGRWDYSAIGTVTNLAARLCGEAKAGQILISHHLVGTIDDLVECELVGELPLKGFQRPVTRFHGAPPQALTARVGGASRTGRAHLPLLDDLVGAQQHRGGDRSKGFSFPAAPGRRSKAQRAKRLKQGK